MPFEPIRIVDLDLERSQKSVSEPGLWDMHLRLSRIPHADWDAIFNDVRKFPRHSMWRRARVSGNHIIVQCPPEEIEKYHLGDLKEDVAVTNEKYQTLVSKQEAYARRVTEEQRVEKEKLEQVKSRLKFD